MLSVEESARYLGREYAALNNLVAWAFWISTNMVLPYGSDGNGYEGWMTADHGKG